MRIRLLASTLAMVIGLGLPNAAEAQILDRLKGAAEDAVAREAQLQIERLLRDAIRCTLNDPSCPEKAKEEGKDAIYVDEDGEVITDDDGVPITDREAARGRAGVGSDEEEAGPGEGVWANYDFVPGEEILFFDDYSADRVGDFPRRMNFVRGNWEVVEWEGRRLLRNSGRRYAAVEIPLPRELPERFTIEFDAYLPHANHRFAVATYSPVSNGRGNWTTLEGNFIQVGTQGQGTGVMARRGRGVQSVTRTERLQEEMQPVRIMVDGRYAKVYVGSERVANVPNAELQRSGTVYLENMYMNSPDHPFYLGPIRIAAGGANLYDDLLEDGRATTRGLRFAIDSDRIRPESTPTLEAIGAMLQEHPDLRLRIEGHTDADGDEAYNQQLSERRAAAVQRYLVERHGIDGDRLEAVGRGEAEPVADNASAEGKQKNRRVELVRVDA